MDSDDCVIICSFDTSIVLVWVFAITIKELVRVHVYVPMLMSQVLIMLLFQNLDVYVCLIKCIHVCLIVPPSINKDY